MRLAEHNRAAGRMNAACAVLNGFGVVLPSCRALAAGRLDVSLGAGLGGGWFAVYMVRGRSYNALPALVLPMRNAAFMFCAYVLRFPALRLLLQTFVPAIC